MSWTYLWWIAIAGALWLIADTASGQSTQLRVELNRLEPREGSCRVWFVASNPDAAQLDPLRLDLVLFGRDGVVGRRLAVDVGPLPPKRTVVRLFDVPQGCDSIGQLLLNDVLACGGSDAEQRASCTDRLALGSRVPGVSFEK